MKIRLLTFVTAIWLSQGHAFASTPAQQPPAPSTWLLVLSATPAYSLADEILWSASPGEWYRVHLREGNWALVVWEFDPPESVVWMAIDRRVRLVQDVPPLAPPRTPIPTAPPLSAERCLIVVQGGFGRNVPEVGQALIEGHVRNNCPGQVAGSIRLSSLVVVGSEDSNIPGYDRFTILLGTFEPGETRSFQIPVGHLAFATYSWRYQITNRPVGSIGHGLPCWHIGPRPCFFADARLEGAVAELWSIEVGQQLLAMAAEHGAIVRTDHLPIGVYAVYRPASRMIVVDDRLTSGLEYGPRERAAILAHELQHVADHAAGRLVETGLGCFANEEDAFRRQAEVWALLWQGRLPAGTNSVRAELNEITLMAFRDPYLLIRSYLPAYGHQCS